MNVVIFNAQVQDCIAKIQCFSFYRKCSNYAKRGFIHKFDIMRYQRQSLERAESGMYCIVDLGCDRPF